MKTFTNNGLQRFITGMVLATLFWSVFFYFPVRAFSYLLGIILGFILLFEWNQIFKRTSISYWGLLPFYPVLPFILLIWLNEHSSYHILVYFLFVIVFTFDTGAYLAGTLLGKYKLWPTISPGKTLEGALGGYISALIMISFVLHQENYFNNVSFFTIALGAFCICFIALLGDFFESFLKRQAGLKDSGAILPGHGGFLDRFDAVMMVTYFIFFAKDWLLSLLMSS